MVWSNSCSHKSLLPESSPSQSANFIRRLIMTLFSIDDVGTTRSYDYSDATLVKASRYTARSPMTSASFADAFFNRYPALSEMKWDNLAIRGGAVVDILMGRNPKDLDLFIFGLNTPEECVNKAREVLNFLLRAEKKSVEEYNKAAKEHAREHGYEDPSVRKMSIKAVRKGCVVTVWAGALKSSIQIVLCNYGSLEEVVRQVDLSVCGASFDGSSVWVTEGGKWSLENMAIRVETEEFFPSSARLKKYFDKGFDIVLPGLDVAKLPTNYHRLGLADAFESPSLTFSYSGITKNKILLNAFHFSINEMPDEDTDNGLGYDEDNGRTTFVNATDNKTVLYANIEKLVSVSSASNPSNNADDSTTVARDFHVFAEADFVTGCLAAWPMLTSRQVENTLEGARHEIFRGPLLNFAKFEQFIKVVDLKDFFKAVTDKAAEEGCGFQKACKELLLVAIEKQKAICNSKLPELTAYYQDKLPPVLTPETLFKSSTIKGGDNFYGKYTKED